MQQYVYNGKNEKDFYYEFIHNVRCDYSKEPTDDGGVDEPYGVIIVPNDYDTDWMAYRKFYLGWKVVVAPVAERFIKAEYQKPGDFQRFEGDTPVKEPVWKVDKEEMYADKYRPNADELKSLKTTLLMELDKLS